MAIAKESWSKIQSYYETGKNPSEIVRLMDEVHVKVDRTSIVKRAKKEEWNNQKFTPLKNEKINSANSLIEVEKKIHALDSETVKSVINELVERELNIKEYAEDTQYAILDVMRKAAKAADRFIENNSNGLYVKKQDDKGITYGLTTEVIPHLAPVLNGATTITKDDKPTTAIQINNENKIEDKVIINIEGI